MPRPVESGGLGAEAAQGYSADGETAPRGEDAPLAFLPQRELVAARRLARRTADATVALLPDGTLVLLLLVAWATYGASPVAAATLLALAFWTAKKQRQAAAAQTAAAPQALTRPLPPPPSEGATASPPKQTTTKPATVVRQITTTGPSFPPFALRILVVHEWRTILGHIREGLATRGVDPSAVRLGMDARTVKRWLAATPPPNVVLVDAEHPERHTVVEAVAAAQGVPSAPSIPGVRACDSVRAGSIPLVIFGTDVGELAEAREDLASRPAVASHPTSFVAGVRAAVLADAIVQAIGGGSLAARPGVQAGSFLYVGSDRLDDSDPEDEPLTAAEAYDAAGLSLP